VRRILFTLTALVVALVVTGAPEADDQTPLGPLWATVNLCDSANAPNAMGVRASVPGTPAADQVRVQFSAQYFSQQKGAWLPVTGSGTSPWLDAGAEYDYQQVGWIFAFDAPEPGKTFTVRGVAQIQWLKQGSVVRSTSRLTSGGITGVDVGDGARPSCVIQ
jgi:hypothetical protein